MCLYMTSSATYVQVITEYITKANIHEYSRRYAIAYTALGLNVEQRILITTKRSKLWQVMMFTCPIRILSIDLH